MWRPDFIDRLPRFRDLRRRDLVASTVATAAALYSLYALRRRQLQLRVDYARLEETRAQIAQLEKALRENETLLNALSPELVLLQRLAFPEEVGKKKSGYYFFDSSGKKSSKWDEFDVEEEMRKVDDPSGEAEREEKRQQRVTFEIGFIKSKLAKAHVSLEKIDRTNDKISGDVEVRKRRKKIANKCDVLSQFKCELADQLQSIVRKVAAQAPPAVSALPAEPAAPTSEPPPPTEPPTEPPATPAEPTQPEAKAE